MKKIEIPTYNPNQVIGKTKIRLNATGQGEQFGPLGAVAGALQTASDVILSKYQDDERDQQAAEKTEFDLYAVKQSGVLRASLADIGEEEDFVALSNDKVTDWVSEFPKHQRDIATKYATSVLGQSHISWQNRTKKFLKEKQVEKSFALLSELNKDIANMAYNGEPTVELLEQASSLIANLPLKSRLKAIGNLSKLDTQNRVDGTLWRAFDEDGVAGVEGAMKTITDNPAFKTLGDVEKRAISNYSNQVYAKIKNQNTVQFKQENDAETLENTLSDARGLLATGAMLDGRKKEDRSLADTVLADDLKGVGDVNAQTEILSQTKKQFGFYPPMVKSILRKTGTAEDLSYALNLWDEMRKTGGVDTLSFSEQYKDIPAKLTTASVMLQSGQSMENVLEHFKYIDSPQNQSNVALNIKSLKDLEIDFNAKAQNVFDVLPSNTFGIGYSGGGPFVDEYKSLYISHYKKYGVEKAAEQFANDGISAKWGVSKFTGARPMPYSPEKMVSSLVQNTTEYRGVVDDMLDVDYKEFLLKQGLAKLIKSVKTPGVFPFTMGAITPAEYTLVNDGVSIISDGQTIKEANDLVKGVPPSYAVSYFDENSGVMMIAKERYRPDVEGIRKAVDVAERKDYDRSIKNRAIALEKMNTLNLGGL